MYESPARIDLGRLAHLAACGQLYQASDSLTGTVGTGGNYALWNPGTKGLATRLIGVRVSVSAAVVVTLGRVVADPALALGNPPSNLYLGGNAPQTLNQAAVAVPLVPDSIIAVQFISTSFGGDILLPASIFIPPNSGVLLATAVAVSTHHVTWLYAELPPEDESD